MKIFYNGAGELTRTPIRGDNKFSGSNKANHILVTWETEPNSLSDVEIQITRSDNQSLGFLPMSYFETVEGVKVYRYILQEPDTALDGKLDIDVKWKYVASGITKTQTGAEVTGFVHKGAYNYIPDPDLEALSEIFNETNDYLQYIDLKQNASFFPFATGEDTKLLVKVSDAEETFNLPTGDISHTYDRAGIYKITVSGTNPHTYDWGDGNTEEIASAFEGFELGSETPDTRILAVYFGDSCPVNALCFANCTELAFVGFSQTYALTQLEEYAFQNCTKLKNITFPSSITQVYRGAFDNVTASISLPGLTTANGFAFQDYKGDRLVLPSTFNRADLLSFWGCKCNSIHFDGDRTWGVGTTGFASIGEINEDAFNEVQAVVTYAGGNFLETYLACGGTLLQSNEYDHTQRTDNPHEVDKKQVGLSHVDNVKQLPVSYLDTDNTLGGASASDEKVPSQKAVYERIKANSMEVQANLGETEVSLPTFVRGKVVSNLTNDLHFQTDTDVSTTVAPLFKDVTYAAATGILTFTKFDDTTKAVDLPLELIIESGSYDAETQELVLILANADEIRIPVADLVNEYYGDDITVELYTDAEDENKLKFRLTTAYKALIDNAVPNTTTVNGKQLNANITLNAEDVAYDETKNTKEVLDDKVANTSNILIGDGNGNAVDSGISASTILNTLTAVTTTGNPVNIQNTNDGFVDKVKILNETASAIESPLTGKSVAKNLFPNVFVNRSGSGVTATINSNGSISMSGTATSAASLAVAGSYGSARPTIFVLDAGTYRLKTYGIKTGISIEVFTDTTLRFNQSLPARIYASPINITSYIITVTSGTNVDGVILYPQIEVGSVETDYEPYTATAFSIPLKDTSGTVLDLNPADVIEMIDGKYHLDSTELHDDSQDALHSIATFAGQTNLIGDQPFTFDVTEFQLGLESIDAMLTLPDGTRVNVLTKDRLIYITSGDYAGKTLDYVLQELKNEIDGKAQDSEVIKKTGDQSIAGVKTFSDSPIIPDATTSGQAVNKSQLDTKEDSLTFDTTPTAGSNNPVTSAGTKIYVDTNIASLESGILYDQVIRTQPDFETLIASPTWLDAKSVALVGQFTLSTTDNIGIKIPSTVKQIHGFNSAKITITNYLYNLSTAKGGLWYDTLPTTPDYSICDLEVDCTGTGGNGYGFYNCTNLTNCTGTGTGTNGYGFGYCTNLTNCTGTGTGGNGFGYGFRDCRNLTNCTGTGTGTTNGYGFHNCTNLTNCTGTGTGTNGYGFGYCTNLTNCTGTGTGGNGYGFYNCTNLTNCTGTGTGIAASGYGFYSITYASNCKDGGSSTAMWGGTNKNINLETCRKTPVEVTAGELTTLNT